MWSVTCNLICLRHLFTSIDSSTAFEITVVLIVDGNSEHVAHARRKIDLSREKKTICDCSRSDQMPKTDQITEIAPSLPISNLI